MKEINGYWFDERNNGWDCYRFTEEEAIEHSRSLIDCGYCYNCHHCRDSVSCVNCHNLRDSVYCYNLRKSANCYHCRDSVSCIDCARCLDCRNLSSCHNCQRCVNCHSCDGCYNCHDLRNCHDCHDYLIQPLIYTTGKIGSRNDNTTFYYGDTEKGKSLQVVCGCFHGNLKEFEAAVMKTHAENDEYRNQYLKEIEKVKVLFELEKE